MFYEAFENFSSGNFSSGIFPLESGVLCVYIFVLLCNVLYLILLPESLWGKLYNISELQKKLVIMLTRKSTTPSSMTFKK